MATNIKRVKLTIFAEKYWTKDIESLLAIDSSRFNDVKAFIIETVQQSQVDKEKN